MVKVIVLCQKKQMDGSTTIYYLLYKKGTGKQKNDQQTILNYVFVMQNLRSSTNNQYKIKFKVYLGMYYNIQFCTFSYLFKY